MPCPFDEEGLEEYAKAIDAGAAAWEDIFESEAMELFAKEREFTLTTLDQRVPQGDYISPTEMAEYSLEMEAFWETQTEVWRTVYHPVFETYMEAQGAEIAATWGYAFDVENPWVQRFLQDYVMTFAEGVVGTSGQSVAGIIAEAQHMGWSIPQIRNELMTAFDMSKNRATMIARTETIRSSNMASLALYKEMGLIRFYWYAKKDDRTCDFCLDMHIRYGPGTEGQVIGQTFYDVGGSMTAPSSEDPEKMLTMVFNYEPVYCAPLHPNCRCTVAPVVETGGA